MKSVKESRTNIIKFSGTPDNSLIFEATSPLIKVSPRHVSNLAGCHWLMDDRVERMRIPESQDEDEKSPKNQPEDNPNEILELYDKWANIYGVA
ncbi:hypothetical protein VNO77_42090 [Canavalia gladiata]|uniref:Uncharacterized protein n=1 Tax=Canavalia gladiata TaxID=3824 RepID=A0AAN9K0Z6_CANGL